MSTTEETAGGDASTGPVIGFTDTPDLRKKIKTAFKRLADIDAQRESLSADKKSIIDDLVAKGLNRGGLKAAYRRFTTDSEKRAAHDHTLMVACAATDCEFDQGDLFREPAGAAKH